MLEHCARAGIVSIVDTIVIIVCILCSIETTVLVHVNADISRIPIGLRAVTVVVFVEFSVAIDVIITGIPHVVSIDVGLIGIGCPRTVVIKVANTIPITVSLYRPKMDSSVEGITSAVLIWIREVVSIRGLATCTESDGTGLAA